MSVFKRGRILRDAHAGDGLASIDGKQYPFRLVACCLGVAIAAMLLAACGRSAAPAIGSGVTLSTLPLERGFYVASDTACDAASNATLLLYRGDGFNGAHDTCEFQSIEQTGSNSYRVIERCHVLQEGPDNATTGVADWTLPDGASFTSASETGWQRDFRHCEQSSLPDPWRDNDISELIGTPQ